MTPRFNTLASSVALMAIVGAGAANAQMAENKSATNSGSVVNSLGAISIGSGGGIPAVAGSATVSATGAAAVTSVGPY